MSTVPVDRARAGSAPAEPEGRTGGWSAVVVNFNAGPLLTRCVRSLVADTSAGAAPEVVVVDNGSEDGSVDELLDACPGTRVVRPGANLGYARAANLGIAAAGHDVVAVLNADVDVHPGTGAAMLGRFAREPRLGALGPHIVEASGATYPSVRRIPTMVESAGHAVLAPVWPGNPFTRRYRQEDEDPAQVRDADWVSGAAIWLRRAALDEIGGWDERFFLFMEDVDVCWRLRGAGWRVSYEPGGEVLHVEGVSRARHPYRSIVAHHRSALRFAAKRWRGVRRLALGPAAVVFALRAAALCARQGLHDVTRSRGR
ncbi:MAG TPA: glycosyltransferase family 2 protein [Acidimicrobiia bacterium]|nr:glycosyltransferase family 2 protein [Acidimicrobiia bacterium]